MKNELSKTEQPCTIHSVGTRCFWFTLINGKVTRLEGEVLDSPKNREWPYKMKGKCMATGKEYIELVYHGDLTIAKYAIPFNEKGQFIGTD